MNQYIGALGASSAERGSARDRGATGSADGGTDDDGQSGGDGGRSAPGAELAACWLSARRLRESVFGPELFSDPAWDILLDLYANGAKGKKTQITGLAPVTGLPSSTAGRWARKLVREGWVTRVRDPHDGRRTFISLSEKGWQFMTLYFGELLSRRGRNTREEP